MVSIFFDLILKALQGFSWVAPTGCVPDSVPDSII